MSATRAISELTGVLAKAGGTLVVLSALAYFIGYKIQSAYLAEVGANWAIQLFTSSELIRTGQSVILIVGISIFVSTMYVFENGSAEKLRRVDIVLGGISILLLIAASITGQYWENYKTDYLLSILAGTLMAAVTCSPVLVPA